MNLVLLYFWRRITDKKEIPIFGSYSNETTIELALNCLQLACVLIYAKPVNTQIIDKIQADSHLSNFKTLILKNTNSAQFANIFGVSISQINEWRDIELIYKGIKDIFNKSLERNYERDFLKEAMSLLAKITKINHKFLDDLYLYDYDFNFLLVSTCHFISHFAIKPGGEGLAYLNLSLLQQYAERREFAINLNKMCKITAEVDLAYTDSTYADCFIVFIRDMVISKKVRLEKLGMSLLSILSNMYFFNLYKTDIKDHHI